MKNLELLIEEIRLNEAELKGRQFNEISRFKSGELTYTVKMRHDRVKILTNDNKIVFIKVVSPDIAITLLSSQKRDGAITRTPNEKESNLQRKVRDRIDKTFNKMYGLLTPEEVEKFGAQDAMPQLLGVLKEYFNKYNAAYIMFSAFRDSNSKRERFYDTTLRRLGYTKILSQVNGPSKHKYYLYSKNKNDNFKKILNVDNANPVGRFFDNQLMPSARTGKAILSNI